MYTIQIILGRDEGTHVDECACPLTGGVATDGGVGGGASGLEANRRSSGIAVRVRKTSAGVEGLEVLVGSTRVDLHRGHEVVTLGDGNLHLHKHGRAPGVGAAAVGVELALRLVAVRASADDVGVDRDDVPFDDDVGGVVGLEAWCILR